MTFPSLFYEITAILLLAALVGVLGTWLRQRVIVSFIAVGMLVGPAGLGIITEHEQVALLAEMGIALLLFVVGLKLDLHLIRTMGPVALATGLGQVLFTSVFGFLIALGLGLSPLTATYVAVALTFSSTIIIVKLLSDKREIDALHGRIAIGFLIVQDIVVVLVMIGLTAMGGEAAGHSFGWEMLLVAGKGVGFLLVIALLTRFVIPPFLQYLARTPELLVLFAIAWAVSLAAGGDSLGFSKEVGAFLAGVSLASTPFREAIGSRLVSLRDFLLLFFFIDLGARLDLGLLGAQILPAAVLSLFVLIGNPVIVMVIMGLMGYRKRTGFLAGLTVAQISEFSLILGALGLTLGHITMETMGLITLVGLVTIGTSTYMIIYSAHLYKLLSPLLSIFERRTPYREMTDAADLPAVDVIIFGLGDYGGNIARRLLRLNKSVVGVDFDPQVLTEWRQRGLPVLYGDAEDPEIYEHLPINRSHWVVCAAPDRHSNLALLQVLKERHFAGKVVLTARSQEDAEDFLEAGGDLVFRPFMDASEQAAETLTAAMLTLPKELLWSMQLKEIRLPPGSVFSGKPIGGIPLRTETGVTILAVSRAGRHIFDPKPDFPVFPGDRLVLVGEVGNLERAAAYLESQELGEPLAADEKFTLGCLAVVPESPWIGQTLAQLQFRQAYGVTVIGIRRQDQRVSTPGPDEVLQAEDRLIVAGTQRAVDRLASAAPALCRLEA
jgi:Kef-type K+ transport system membrane component KefB/Trk K+ transport system NAD-binding subunit